MKLEEIANQRLLGSKTKETNLLVPRNDEQKTQRDTERLAEYLVEQFNAPEYREGFLKVAWRLDTGTIHRYVGTAKELGTNKRAYFMTCARNEMRRRGVL